MKTKKNKLGNVLLITGIFLLLIGVVGIIITLFFQDNDKYSGIYQLNDNYIRLLKINKEEIIYTLNGKTNFRGGAKIDGNKALYNSNNITDSFTITDDLIFNSNDNLIINGTYKKIDKFDISDYYQYYYGDPNYLNSKYNGKYQYNGITLYLFQTDENTVHGYLKKGNTINYLKYEIQYDESLFVSWNNNIYTISFFKTGLSFITIEGEKIYDGLYVKEEKLEMKDIITNVLGALKNGGRT